MGNKTADKYHEGKHFVKVLFMLFFCLNPLFLLSQNIPTRNFTMRDGLPSMSIQCVFKDSRGLMWIGTKSGLCSFDGKTFHIFKPSEGMTASQIWAITEDEEGNLWFGSYGDGLYKYDGKDFERFTKKDGLVSDYIRVLCYSKSFHCLVAGSEGGISTIKGNTISSSPSEIFTKKIGYTVTGLADAGKFIYITTYGHNNPLRYYPDKNKFICASDSGKYYPTHSFSVYITSKGDTAFSLGHLGMTLIKKDSVVRNNSMGQIFGIAEDRRGDLWMASWSYQNRDMQEGIFKYDGKTFRNYQKEFGITDKEIWAVYYDREQDILWIGTTNEGLFRVNFSSITKFPSSYFGLVDNQINDMFVDSNNILWIATRKELIQMKPDGSYSFMNKHPMILEFRNYWKKLNRIPQAQIDMTIKKARRLEASGLAEFENQTDFEYQRITNDYDQSIVFSNQFGLFHYNKTDNKIDYWGPEGSIHEIAVMGRDTMIYCGWGHAVLNPKFRNDPAEITDLSLLYFTPKRDPWNISNLKKFGDRFWYTSWTSGLWTSKGMHLENINQTDNSISNNLNNICFDEKGHVIFGSNSGEICIGTYDESKLKIEYRINQNNGLQGNSILWLLADQKGKLWAGTNRGLNCIDLEELLSKGNYKIRFFDEEDGYTGHSAQRVAMDKNDNLWLGAGNDLLKIETGKLFDHHNEKGKIILATIDINHMPIDSTKGLGLNRWTSVPENKFVLKHAENNLVFYFDIRNYRNPSKDMFRYRLNGYDKIWSNWNESRKAVYTNLPPGKYSLYVESFNITTNDQAEPLRVEFTIRYPWWGLWYVKLIAFVVWITLMIFVIRKYTELDRVKQIKKLEIEKTIVNLEIQALQAQMNPHFIFNCINGIQYYVLSNKMDEVLAYLSDFSKVVRESLANANLRLIPLEQEIDFLKSYLRLEQMRFPDKFDFNILCNGNESFDTIMFPPMLVQPFVENSIRHGFMSLKKKGHLSVVFEVKGKDTIKVTIADNGTGRKKDHLEEDISFENDRPHSAQITETRVRLFNSPNEPEKYTIVYFDLSDNGKSRGLKTELFLPMEKRRS